jgi:hypothetical protein
MKTSNLTVRRCYMQSGSHSLHYCVVHAYQCSLHNSTYICKCSGLDGWSTICDIPPPHCAERLWQNQLLTLYWRGHILLLQSLMTRAALLLGLTVWSRGATKLYLRIQSIFSKRTQLATITNINLLTLFKEIIAIYTENHTEPSNTKYIVTNSYAAGICINTTRL